MRVKSNIFYDANASSLIEQYDSLSFKQVHQSWADLFSIKAGMRILDVGAGSGRDARFFAQNSQLEVYAVEPSLRLFEHGLKSNSFSNLHWVNDALPNLANINVINRNVENGKFDLILLSAVWMHLSIDQRVKSFNTLSNLLNDKGLLIVTLRYGQSEYDLTFRHMHKVSSLEITKLAKDKGLSLIRLTEIDKDQLLRKSVNWQTVVFKK